MNNKIEVLITKEFLHAFLERCNLNFSNTIKTFDDLENISNTMGWVEAFEYACKQHKVDQLYNYYSLLDWRESDVFAAEVDYMVLNEGLIQTQQEIEAELIAVSEKEYQEIEDTYEFIWGIASYDNLSGTEANLHTLNDLDIIYNKEREKYFINVETIYSFDTKQAEFKYFERLLEYFTIWMKEQKYDITYINSSVDLFSGGYGFSEGFETIEEAYAYFKLMVNAFIAQ